MLGFATAERDAGWAYPRPVKDALRLGFCHADGAGRNVDVRRKAKPETIASFL